jgi:hypothetical protein
LTLVQHQVTRYRGRRGRDLRVSGRQDFHRVVVRVDLARVGLDILLNAVVPNLPPL